jgi:polyisoprenoid-binding protein YceI
MKRNSRFVAIFALLAGAVLPALGDTETFGFDKAHSLIGFRVRHVLSKVEGRFKSFDGTIWLDRQKPAASRVELTIQAASIDTANENRDNDLRSANYFDVAKYPTITFKSTKVEPKGNDLYEVTGEFSMHGVTKTIKVPVKHLGFAPGKTEKAGFGSGASDRPEGLRHHHRSPSSATRSRSTSRSRANKAKPERRSPPRRRPRRADPGLSFHLPVPLLSQSPSHQLGTGGLRERETG